ncbi:hypothetical protein EYC59_04400 [Candidatus Saccharibacteria bacterium]|nr:MAG: hypothetical protein EYC59_04400 [Candidatus Saccharibacteria bacterium]
MNSVDFVSSELSGLDFLSPGDEARLHVPVLGRNVQFRNFTPDLPMGTLKVSADIGSVAIQLEDTKPFQVVDWLKTEGDDSQAGAFFDRELPAIVMEKDAAGLWLPVLAECTIRPGLENSFRQFVDMAVNNAVEKLF